MAAKNQGKSGAPAVDIGVLAGVVDNTYKRFDDSVEEARKLQLFINFANGMARNPFGHEDVVTLPFVLGAGNGVDPVAQENSPVDVARLYDSIKALDAPLTKIVQTLAILDRHRGSVETLHADIKAAAEVSGMVPESIASLRSDLAEMSGRIEMATGQGFARLSDELRGSAPASSKGPGVPDLAGMVAKAMRDATSRMVTEIVSVLREWGDQRPSDATASEAPTEPIVPVVVSVESDIAPAGDLDKGDPIGDTIEVGVDGEQSMTSIELVQDPSVDHEEEAGMLRLENPEGPIRLYGILISPERVEKAHVVIQHALAAKAAGESKPVTEFKIPASGWKNVLFQAVLGWQEEEAEDDPEIVRSLADVDFADIYDEVVSPEPETGGDVGLPVMPMGGTKEMNDVVIAFVKESGGKVTSRQLRDMLESRYTPVRAQSYAYWLLNATPGLVKKGGVWLLG